MVLKFEFYLCINISIILGYTFIYFKIFVRHCYKQKVDFYLCYTMCQVLSHKRSFVYLPFYNKGKLQIKKDCLGQSTRFKVKLSHIFFIMIESSAGEGRYHHNFLFNV